MAWAPYSSTTFAAVTCEGKVFVYDLSVNKYSPICVQVKIVISSDQQPLHCEGSTVCIRMTLQTIVTKKVGVLNHIAFNPCEPVLVVGDSRGHVHTLKLSPNLRKRSREAQAALNNGETKLFRDIETKKLEQVVSQVMEPVTRDTGETEQD